MVDQKKRELQDHGNREFPVAVYDWYGPNSSGMVLEVHWHEGWEFLAVYEGSAVFTVNGERRLLTPSDLLLIPGNSMHMAEQHMNRFCRYRSIVFSMSMLKGLLEDTVQLKYIDPLCVSFPQTGLLIPGRLPPPEGWPTGKIYALFEKTFHVLFEGQAAYEILAKAYLYELLAYAIVLWGQKKEEEDGGQQTTSKTKGIRAAIVYMTENLQNQIALSQLAEIANISIGHFGKLFKQMTSYSPIDYLMNLRLMRAANLLKNTDEQILSIALDVGFNNLGHFIRSYKKKFNCTPREYRKRERQSRGV